jgi:hypothetical protein
MKSIELTQEHKDKLLEMCKELFSEYTWDFSWLYREGNIKFWNKEMLNARFIHWFEFCMTKLSSALKLTSNQIYNCFSCSVNSEGDPFIHPVNFLYEEYLKLK